ncbi:MAG: hypothetical protein LBM98_08750 [Oscillospiraceae bacterium]|jgi:hypothetical protein|nr:hypothetical protein [Oscillospiraceae bacterium]
MPDKITALLMERQHLTRPATREEYIKLYRDLSPGYNVYWNGFGNPPTLTYRADFDDMEFNRRRQASRELVKARLIGGNIGWISAEDLELYSCLYRKPLTKPAERQQILLELIEHVGPLNIQQMKELTGLLVKEITPALHRLQEAFLLYEDQNEGQDDRAWYQFGEMFPNVDFKRYSRVDALKILLKRFAERFVAFDVKQAKSYFKVTEKEIKSTLGEFAETEQGYMLKADFELLKTYTAEGKHSVFSMHRNDFLVKADEHMLKAKYQHDYPDTLYYLLIDGQWRGAVAGKFRYSPEVSDVILDLPSEEVNSRQCEIVAAIKRLCGKEPEKIMGVEIQ